MGENIISSCISQYCRFLGIYFFIFFIGKIHPALVLDSHKVRSIFFQGQLWPDCETCGYFCQTFLFFVLISDHWINLFLVQLASHIVTYFLECHQFLRLWNKLGKWIRNWNICVCRWMGLIWRKLMEARLQLQTGIPAMVLNLFCSFVLLNKAQMHLVFLVQACFVVM